MDDCIFTGNSATAGGAIYNGGTLTVNGCSFFDNSAFDGGGIDNEGTANVAASSFTSNSSTDRGAAIFNSGTLTVLACTMSKNSARVTGGGIENYGSTTVNNSTFANNSATYGGGLGNEVGATTALTNCTIYGNTASINGGGIAAAGTNPFVLIDCTISGNKSASGGGIETGQQGSAGTLTNTIVAGNTATGTGPDINVVNGSPLSGSYNLIGNGTGLTGISNGNAGHNQVGVSVANVGLDPTGLQNNGGPTQTIALLPGSRAIGAGATSATPTADQRGVARPVGSPSDIGAYQTTNVTLQTVGASLSTAPSIPLSTLPSLPAGATAVLPAVTKFTVSNVTPGGSATVVLQLPAGTLQPNTAYAYFKYDPNNPSSSAWVRVNPGVATFSVAQQTVTLNLKDDGVVADGDEDAADNGDILNPGVPVMLAPSKVQATTTRLTASPNPAVFGQAMTFTDLGGRAEPWRGAPTGTVGFYIDGAFYGTTALSGATASIGISGLSVGYHDVTAVYSGAASFLASYSTVTQTVNQANTTTRITVAPNPVVFGQAATFTASVGVAKPGAGAPTGTVGFYIDGAFYGTTALSGATASIGISGLSVGYHDVTAIYLGDASFLASYGTVTQTVNQANTTTRITVAPNPVVFGQAATVTASVGVVNPGAGAPTGSVQFFVDGLYFGTTALSGATASISISGLPVGNHTVQAIYLGDASFLTSYSTVFETVLR